jgi:hypothetical protein
LSFWGSSLDDVYWTPDYDTVYHLAAGNLTFVRLATCIVDHWGASASDVHAAGFQAHCSIGADNWGARSTA